GAWPLKEMPSSPSRISGSNSMRKTKTANSGASLPASAIIGLPPAQASQVRMLRRWNSEPTEEPDHHMEDHRQQRAQQKLCVIPRWVHQHDRLGNKRSDAGRLRRAAGRGRRAVDGAPKAVAQARQRDARSRKELLVIEGDDLRAPPGLQVALEIRGDVDGGNGFAGSDLTGGGREIAGPFDDVETGRRGHLFHEDARGIGSVRVDDDNPEVADDRMTEHRGQHR